MKNWLIKKLGGFVSTDDFIEKIRQLEFEDKYKILTLSVKKMFNTISSEDIFKQENGKYTFEGRELSHEESELLKQSAKTFQTSTLWRMLEKELKYQANKKIYIDSQNEMDLLAGKLMMYVIDIIKTKINRM